MLESFNFIGDEALLSREELGQLEMGLSEGTYLFGVKSLSKRVRVIEFTNDCILERFPQMTVRRLR